MMQPLVTVICICYNQKKFLREAVSSVLQQTYPNIQLIVADDFSTDGSQQEIVQLKQEQASLELLLQDENIGHCKIFNKALALAKGEFIIDLAADDVLLPERIAEGIAVLTSSGPGYGLNFSDAAYISEGGVELYLHSDKFPHKTIPQGDVYQHIIQKYFVCPPTMMFRKDLIEQIGGYDESLAYEDFDFLVRASRISSFCYTQKVLVKRRLHNASHGQKQFEILTKQSESTYRVCKKILDLNRSNDEKMALSKRLKYEIRLNIRLLNFSVANRFFLLWKENQQKQYTV